MKVVQSTDNLRRVEEGGGVVEPAGAPEVTEQLPAADVGEKHVEEALVLGAPAQVHKEWVIDFLQRKNPMTNVEFKHLEFWSALRRDASVTEVTTKSYISIERMKRFKSSL